MELHLHTNAFKDNLTIDMQLEKEFTKEINTIQNIEYARMLIKRLYSDIRKYRDKQGFTVYLKDTMEIPGMKK